MRTALTGAFQGGYLERTAGSGAWPCEAADARFVVVQARQSREPEPSAGPRPPLPPPAPNTLRASAALDSGQIMDLAESIDKLFQASALPHVQFTLTVGIQLSGSEPLPDELVKRMNTLLKEISPNLQLGSATER